MPAAPTGPASTAHLLELADRCVACGLCLPRCPTYGLERNEADSPRGRIALMRGLATGQLARGPALAGHLSRCLGCRACEAACPSGVAYGRLLDGTRAAFSLTPRALRARAAQALLGRYRRRVAYRSPGLPGAPAVRLFAGCATSLLDRTTLRDAVRVLEAAGFAVQIPAGQGCCGAVYQHYGRPRDAARAARRNLTAFGGEPAVPLLSLASGCGATLAEYGHLLPENGAALAARHREWTAFLAGHDWPSAPRLAPLDRPLWVHEPCTQRNVLGAASAIYALLRRIPGADPRPLPDNDRCCGGAGLYPLMHPRTARRLGAAKGRGLAGLDGALVASTNLACCLQLRRAARAAGVRLTVVHPASVLARQLGPGPKG